MKHYIIFALLLLSGFKVQAQLPANFNLAPDLGFHDHTLTDTSLNANCWMNSSSITLFAALPNFANMYFSDSSLERKLLKTGTLLLPLIEDYHYYETSTGRLLDTPADMPRAYPATKLLEPLIAGYTYTFTMYLPVIIPAKRSVAERAWLSYTSFYPGIFFVKNVGVHFSNTKPSIISAYRRTETPQLNFSDWNITKTDTTELVKLTATYTATGGEQYMTIGNFDEVKDFKYIGPILGDMYYSVGDSTYFPFLSYMYITNISLVRDTTLPMLSLLPLDLGPDRSLCPGDTAIARAQPYYHSYIWSTGDTTSSIVIDRPGVYWCTATLGCATMTDTLKVSTVAIAGFDIRDTTICARDSFLASAPPGHKTYLWSNGATTATQYIKTPGRYWVRVSDPCTVPFADSFQVRTFAPEVASFKLHDTSICGAGLDVSAPIAPHYRWSTGDTTRSLHISAPGTYTLRIYDDCGNSFTDSFRFLRQSYVSPFRIADTSYCGKARISGPLAAHYLWSTGDTTQSIYINTSGSWELTISDDCGNSYSSRFATKVFPEIKPFHIGNIQLCGNQIHAEADRSIGRHFIWSTGDTTTYTLLVTTGQHWICAFDACGASYTDTFEVLPPDVYRQSRDTVICSASGTGQLSLPPGASDIHWSTGATTAGITVTEPGIYFAQAFVNCAVYYDTILVSYCRPQIRNLGADKAEICAGACVQFRTDIDNYPTALSWNFPGAQPDQATGTQAPLVCYQTPGIYTASLIASGKGGADTSTYTITVLDKPQATFDDSLLTLSYDHTLKLFACATGIQIDWYKNDSLICGNCNSIQITGRELNEHYRCVVSNGDCNDSCSYTLHVVDIPHNAWMPNAFSPNGDGRNETFGIITDNPNIQVITFSIYGRYGERVYHAENSNRPWDGAYMGKQQEVGSYYWQISYRVAGSDEIYYQKGDVTLLR